VVIRFKLRLRAVTLLTVGWGIPDVLGADIVHARKLALEKLEGSKVRVAERIYIPGSSVKGVLRTAASRVAAAYGFTSCGETRPDLIAKAHAGVPCDVCKLFGYPEDDPSAASRIWVSDFDLVGGAGKTVVVRVALDNKTLTARQGALYSMEHLLPGSEFEGEIRVDESARELIPLLLLAIAELRTGRFGRRSVVDARVVDGGALDGAVEARWRPLLGELRSWLWEGVVGV
jgi:CRISPR/Cas system CSM-associated protein Csm3 (group 7 of RAMP superfamily)